MTKGYSDREFLDKQSKYLSEGLKAALYGVHDRDGNVVTEPSRVDLDFLSTKYGEPNYSIYSYYKLAFRIIEIGYYTFHVLFLNSR